MIISSQRYLSDETVAAKVEARDFLVTLAVVEHDGETYRIVVDGHHSLEAAKVSGNAPEYIESDYNYQGELDCIGFDDFMARLWIDSDWYDIETGESVW